MKNITFGIFLTLVTTALPSDAQPYWVIETNLNQKNFTIIKFYNEQGEMIHEERQAGVYFDLSKKRHVKKLDAMLQNYLSYGSPISRKETKRQRQRAILVVR